MLSCSHLEAWRVATISRRLKTPSAKNISHNINRISFAFFSCPRHYALHLNYKLVINHTLEITPKIPVVSTSNNFLHLVLFWTGINTEYIMLIPKLLEYFLHVTFEHIIWTISLVLETKLRTLWEKLPINKYYIII